MLSTPVICASTSLPSAKPPRQDTQFLQGKNCCRMVRELWSPLVYVLPLQLFTYFLALARGTQPDLFQQDNAKQAAAKTHYDL